MKSKFNALIQFHPLFSFPFKTLILTPRPLCTTCAGTVLHYSEILEVKRVEDQPNDSRDVFRRWGCSENDISNIFLRRPSLRYTNLTDLQSKLNTLSRIGVTSSGLVKIVNSRPRFLGCCINRCLDEQIKYLQPLFGSKDVLLKAIIRNPSLLTYDFHNKIKPVVDIYDGLGVSGRDFVAMLLSRPFLISRTFLNDEKLEYIRKTKVSKDSKMYKYVVSLIAVSRLKTIHEKVANFEKFGFSDDEVLSLFGRSPLLLTLSIDKVQRNMTFVLGTMKLPASVILDYPFLLFVNLEAVLKPRMVIAGKIHDMGLVPEIKGPVMLTALRMKEKRFVKAFIRCHPEDVANELMKYYRNAKGVKRLAEFSKKTLRNKDSHAEQFWKTGGH